MAGFLLMPGVDLIMKTDVGLTFWHDAILLRILFAAEKIICLDLKVVISGSCIL